MNVVIEELKRGLKYRQRELDSFSQKLDLLREQVLQYENELIPKFLKEIKELTDFINDLEDNPFK